MIPEGNMMTGTSVGGSASKRPVFALLLMALFFSITGGLSAQGPVDIAFGSHGFVIGVVMKDGKAEPATFASGVFISDRHIVTQLGKCCTPPEGVQLKGFVVSSHGQTSVAQPIWQSKEKLIAVFELEKPLGAAPATLAPLKLLQQNQQVFGFGLKEGKPIPVEGVVAGAINMKDSNAKLIQSKLGGEVHQGSGLFDACGNVIGIILGTNQSGDLLSLAVDELADAIAATKTNPQVTGNACAAGGGGTPPQQQEGEKQPGGQQQQQQQQQQKPAQRQAPSGPSDPLKYTLIVVAILLVLAFSSRRGRQEVAKVMTSRRQAPVAGLQQPMIQPPGQYPGQFQGQYAPGQMQVAPPGYYPPGTRPRLRGVNGYYAGNVIELENNAWVLGRDARIANIVFPAATETVSKKHCTISFDPQRHVFVLEDNGSTNGTWLPNGESLGAGRPRDLQPGERFCVGDMNNIFEVVLE